VRDNGKKFYLTRVEQVPQDFDTVAWDTYPVEREWREALAQAADQHWRRRGVTSSSDLALGVAEQQERWHLYKKDLFPGAALCAVLVDAHQRKIYTASVGDCGALLTALPSPNGTSPKGPGRSALGRMSVGFPENGSTSPGPEQELRAGGSRMLSRPHKPADRAELERVCSTSRGFVEVHGVRVTTENASQVAQQVALAQAMGRKALYRINRDVSLSRAIGDWDLKEFGVIATPDVTVYTFDQEECRGQTVVLTLATDGVWDAIDAAEVEKQVVALEAGGDALSLAQRIVETAHSVQKNNDDVTAIVAAFQLLGEADTSPVSHTASAGAEASPAEARPESASRAEEHASRSVSEVESVRSELTECAIGRANLLRTPLEGTVEGGPEPEIDKAETLPM